MCSGLLLDALCTGLPPFCNESLIEVYWLVWSRDCSVLGGDVFFVSWPRFFFVFSAIEKSHVGGVGGRRKTKGKGSSKHLRLWIFLRRHFCAHKNQDPKWLKTTEHSEYCTSHLFGDLSSSWRDDEMVDTPVGCRVLHTIPCAWIRLICHERVYWRCG